MKEKTQTKRRKSGDDRHRQGLGLRRKFMTGILVLVPIVVTFLVLRLVFRWLDGLAQPIIRQLFQTQGDIPGLGIVLTLILIWLAGILAGNVFGRRLIRRGDQVLANLPIIGSIYSPIKQFTEKVVSPQQTGFSQVVLAEYPSEDLWILGFATGEVQLDDWGEIGRCAFVPTSPNPATGWMVIFPPEKIRETPLTVEEAMQLIVSAGIVIPDKLRTIGAYGLTAKDLPKVLDFTPPSESDHSPPPHTTDLPSAQNPEAPPSNQAQSR